ncbi:MAG: hypothetical protein ACOCVE_00170 [Desulfovermiculus sp.]
MQKRSEKNLPLLQPAKRKNISAFGLLTTEKDIIMQVWTETMAIFPAGQAKTTGGTRLPSELTFISCADEYSR